MNGGGGQPIRLEQVEATCEASSYLLKNLQSKGNWVKRKEEIKKDMTTH